MNYTNITFESLLEDFKNRLASDPRFANISSASIYQMFMEMICACMDMTNYYMQRTAEESYIDTARLDSSLIKLGKNLGYNPRRRVPAKCNLQIQIKGPLPQATQPGDTVVFNQDVVDLVFQGRHFILDSSYSYTFSSEDMEGKNSTSWKKTLELACPSQYVHYMPLQGKSLYNAANLVPISCFQGVKVVKEILGNANLGKLGKIAQYYDIDDITFSNWYGKRDPYAFYKGNYSPRLSWTKVGIGENQNEALDDKHVFDIEETSIYLNEHLQQLENIPATPLKICQIETNYDKTVRVRFGNDNYMVCPGLTKKNQNLYVQYLQTDGKEANQTGTSGAQMTNNTSFYLQHKGEIIDITNNITFIIASDIFQGEEFESQDSIRINAPAYFSSRNKLVTKGDFISYFRGLSTPINVQTALVFGQQEIEDFDNKLYKYVQNYVFYSLIGHMYAKQGGNYYPRNVLTDKDDVDDPFSLYSDEYLDHIADYVKMIKSFDGYYNQQYNDTPQEQWLKNIKIIRDNCQDRMEINSRILSIPPMVQYFDLVGRAKVKSNTKLQEYKTNIENKIYEYLDNRNGTTQKIYKSDLIKFYTDEEDTLNVDLDLKVSSIIRADAIQYHWENPTITGQTTAYGAGYLTQDTSLDSLAQFNHSPQLAQQEWGPNWRNVIRVTQKDLYNAFLDPKMLEGCRVLIQLTNIYKNNQKKDEEYIIKVDKVIEKNTGEDEAYFEICPQNALVFNANYEDTAVITINVPKENDFFSKSSFSTYKTDEYKLSHLQIIGIERMLNNWLNHGLTIEEADRAIPLPYKVYANETVTREETYMRKGYELTNYENTISEKAFWMYFIPKIIRTYYYKHIQEDTAMDSPWWKAITVLIQDLYCLCKPAFCDNILDEGNNIVNFSMSNEVAVVRINVEYGYDTTG